MKKVWISMALSMVLLLGACASDKEQGSNQGGVNDGEAPNTNDAIGHGVDEKKVGFSLTGETIEEAENVPSEEKEAILNAFNVYIDAFNKKDIERYLGTLSENTESFDKEEERVYMTEEVFNEYELDRVATDVTIVKYSEKEAQVFSVLETSMKQISSGLAVNPAGRQVTVFTKEDGNWLVSSIHYIGDEEKK
ncbi:nuclear transport factor 2 family protein [Sporosarcina sp. G11-34]|uniref:nuclear transport factor 2 family protein n=1 Tax=Sporosarcina sp. G11-34 TaxID=2849605 RepID=UPI0022A92CDB|nr:nuclear transport factor 2 family protein [Sporosarcina sp. G11-34]MCZ2257646.1 nuclear transport factor 2 family protein [Sporosarcina sp. G11-34]